MVVVVVWGGGLPSFQRFLEERAEGKSAGGALLRGGGTGVRDYDDEKRPKKGRARLEETRRTTRINLYGSATAAHQK